MWSAFGLNDMGSPSLDSLQVEEIVVAVAHCTHAENLTLFVKK